ncbi:MAG: CHAT domain-containing protein, partial [Gemmatimonadetes bacterium]|nr:CHAT domain-containing protein [Gemmatimonadota bacterium]
AARGFAAMGSVGLRNIALLRVVMLHRERGRLDSALAQGRWLQAEWRRLGVPGEEALLWMTLGSIYFEQAEFEAAIAAGDSGLRIAPPDAEPRLLATLHGTRGTGFALTGRYDSALVHHYASVRHWARAGDLYRAEAARATGHLGAVFRQMGQFDSALAYHRTQRGMAPEGTAGELIALRELAYDFEGLGSRDSALAYHELRRAAAQWRRANTTSDPTGDALAESESLDRIGLLRWEAGDAAGADTSFRAALESYRRGGKEWTTPSTLSDIATLFDRIGAADSALAWHRRALALAVATGRTTDRVRSLAAVGRLEARRGDHAAGLAALREAAAIQRSRGAIETGASVLGSLAYTLRRLPEPDLPGALAALDTAAALRAQVRARAGGDEYRLGVQDIATLPAGEWELAWLQYGAATDPERAAYGALAAAERGRAQALLDLMRGTSHTARAGADLVAEGRRLLRAATASGAGVLSYLVTDDTLLIWYARPIAGRVRLTLHPVAVPADTLARLAARWRAALGVDQVELGSRLAGDDGAGVEDVLRIGVAGAASAGTGDATAIGRALAALVLPEELRNAGAGRGELVLVPHGVLSVIPFGALPVGDSTTLGLVRALRYAPSIASLVEVERRPVLGAGPRAARLRQALVVGDPKMPSIVRADGSVAPLLQLPAAREEGEAVARRLGASALSGDLATEREVRRRMARAPLIHLATHGYAYAAGGQARRSFVALAPDSLDEGLLTVGEILDDPALTLSAELVVLIACQTGLGSLRKAEGTVGLQRAFLARGARSLLVSLWSVSDAATALLMRRFYEHWLGDRDRPSKAEALRRAQDEVHRTPGFEAPRFWAPFQVVGGD